MAGRNSRLDSDGFAQAAEPNEEGAALDQTRIVRMRPLSGGTAAATITVPEQDEVAVANADVAEQAEGPRPERPARQRRALGSDTVEFGFESAGAYAPPMRAETAQQPAISVNRIDAAQTRSLNALAARLGHRFQNPVLLVEALTDASVDASLRKGAADNWRLAFVGVRTVGLVLSEMLMHFRRNRAWNELEAAMTELTQAGTLASVAREVNLGSELLVAEQAEVQGRREDRMALATAVAAVVGAVFFDGGYAAARQLVVRLYASRVDALTARLRAAAVPTAASAVQMTPCVQLSALAKQQGSAPMYSAAVETMGGNGRRVQVSVALQLNGKSWRATGEAADATGAENDAARRLLNQLARG